jgi:hypothetical protein
MAFPGIDDREDQEKEYGEETGIEFFQKETLL